MSVRCSQPPSFELFGESEIRLFKCEHILGELELREEHRDKHEQTARKLYRRVMFFENYRARQNADNGFEAHNERGDRGVGVLLPYRLQGKAYARGRDAEVEQREERVAYLGEGGKTEYRHGGDAERGAH